MKSMYFQFDSMQITIYIIMFSKVMEILPLAELAPSSIPKFPSVSRLPKTFTIAYGLILKTTTINIINVLFKILIISPPWPFSPSSIV
jgi:hypothetical protein